MTDEATGGIITRLAPALGNRYRIDREIGAGGMATVYLAHDVKHERAVAIKVLHPDLGAALGGSRFLSEIRTTAKLQHPHILALLDSGEADGLLYYVMPYVAGETLRTRLERERQLPIEDALRIAHEVADALGHAHGLGVIHRDIKPENILLQGGHALVADFGIALAVQQAGGQRITQTGLSLGTPQYMSPEQATGERTIDLRSDIYALGAVTYEMLVGEPPFTGPTVQAIVARLITEDPRRLVTQRKAVPDHVEAAVLRSLEKLPADRFATAAEFSAALQDRSVPATGYTSQGRSAARRIVPRAWFRSIGAGTWLALVAAAAVGWAAAYFSRRDAASTDEMTVTSILAPAGGALGEQRSLALTPDGRRLAFVFAAANGSRTLWLRHLDRLEAEPIPNTAGADAPFWSPDGRSLGYFANGQLMVLDENGVTRRLCPVAQPTGGSWSTKGVILFGHRDGISTVPAAGGSCRRIVPRDAARHTLKAIFLPDGERFLYSRGRDLDMLAADLDGRQLATIPVRTTEFAVVPPGYLIVGGLTDIRSLDAERIDLRTLALDGSIVPLTSDVRSQSGVQTFSVASSGALAFLPGGNDRPYLEYDANGLLRDTVRVDGAWTVSARPRRAGPPLVAVAGNVTGLWLYDLDANRASRLIVRDSTFSRTQDRVAQGTTYPVFNADGSQLVYGIVATTRCGIVERNLTTDVERVVLQETGSDPNQCALPLDWSPDGRDVLVRRDTALQIVAIEGTAGIRQIVRPGRLWEGRFSPDGHYVAYSSDETGRAEVYIQPLPSGPPTRISLDGGRWPTWTHSGRQITFMTPDGRVQEASVASGSPVGIPRTRFSVPSWRRNIFDDRGVGFAVVGDGERFIVRQSPSGLAFAYVQRWQALLRSADSTSRARARQ